MVPPPLHPPNHYYERNNAGSREENHRKMYNNPPSHLSSIPSHLHHSTHTFPSQYGYSHTNQPIPIHNNLPPPPVYNGYNGSHPFYNYHQENIHPTSYPNNGEYHGWNHLPPTNGHSNWNPPPSSKQYSDDNGLFHEVTNQGGRRGERREKREGSINDQPNNRYEESRSPRKRFNSKGDSYSSSTTDSGGLTDDEKKEFTALIQDLWPSQRFAQEFKKYNVGAYIRVRDLLEKVKEIEEDEKEKNGRRIGRQ